MFQQLVKGKMKQFYIERCYPNYRLKFEKFDKVFSYKNVKLWKFDVKNFSHTNVVIDFSVRLRLGLKKEQTIRVNESLSREALSLVYMYKKYGTAYGTGKGVISENKNLIENIRKIGKTKVKFSPSLIQPILDKNRSDILWMENRLGDTLDENLESTIHDIQSENDLLTVDIYIVRELVTLLNGKISDKNYSNNPKDIAILIEELRNNLKEKNSHSYQDKVLLKELVQKVKKSQVNILATMNDDRLSFIVEEVLKQVEIEIGKSKEGYVYIPILGRFDIKQLQKKLEDKIVWRKRILFRTVHSKNI
jgi:hypothetical protein